MDSKNFDQLSTYDSQLKYQTELLMCFFNQQPDFDQAKEMSPATNRVKVETKSMTNLTTDDEYNPFLTFLKAKSDKILPSKMSRKQAMNVWTEYKKAVNKVLPTLRSHLESKKCNLTVLMGLMSSFVSGRGSSVKEVINNIDTVVDFSVKYMVIYYQTDVLCKQEVDLAEVFRFGAYQLLFKDEEINNRLNNVSNNESYLPSKKIPARFLEIIEALKQIPSVRRHLEKTDAQEKAEKIALLNEKKSRLEITVDLLLKSKAQPSRRVRDAHVIDMLMICRDSSENTPFLVKGLNLGFRECPYVLLINLTDLEGRFESRLSNRDREAFKSMLTSIGADMLSAVIILENFFGEELLCRKLPITTKVCTVLRYPENTPERKLTKRTSNFFVQD